MAINRPPLLDPHWLDFALQHVAPTFSLTRTLARVVATRRETPDMTSLRLAPSRRWRGFVPGQHLPVRVVIGGVVHERRYSLTGEPGEATLAITVKSQPSGTVSRWLADEAAPGDVIEIGRAAGDFILPRDAATPLLLIAGGSGITAIRSLVRAALRRRVDADVVLLYYARRYRDFAFASELADLAAAHPACRVAFLAQSPGDGTPAAGKFSAAQLAALAPDHAERDVFLCGPVGLTRAVTHHWAAAGRSHRLKSEAFVAPTADEGTRAAAAISFRRSARTVQSTATTLLAAAEAAGLRPPTGCRMGICRTCTCTKLSGSVRDRVTGVVDSAAGSRIRICVSEPLGPVALDL